MVAMQEQLSAYFHGEKLGGLGFGAAGLVAVLLSLALWRAAPSYRAMMYPLLIVAVIELGVCGVLQLRTDRQVAGLSAELQRDPAAFRAAELPRIRRVLLSFRIIEAVELALFAGGVFLCFAYRGRPAAFAAGLGLILQASAMLACDLAAERRAEDYAAAIDKLT